MTKIAAPLTDEERRNVRALMRLIRAAKAEEIPSLDALEILAFVALAPEEGAVQRDLASMGTIPKNTLSTTARVIGDGRPGSPGLGLITVRGDASDLRSKPLHLTERGATALRSILGSL